MVTLIEYPNCTTCQKAKKWLTEQGVPFETRHIKEQPLTAAELDGFHRLSGLPLKRFFNTSGLAYRALGLKEKLPVLSQEEQLALLASDGMLVKRPLLVGNHFVLVGFQPLAWQQALEGEIKE